MNKNLTTGRHYAAVPRLWPDSTVICLGSGPSLLQSDIDSCRDRAKVICVNDTIRLCSWADALYCCDGRWVDHYKGVPTFTGLKYSLTTQPGKWPGWQILRESGTFGLETEDRGAIRSGRNSGYQAINVAVHLGATRILLLGYDMQRTKGHEHFFGAHPVGVNQPSPYPLFVQAFASLVKPLADHGIEVINCSRHTALTSFSRHALCDALDQRTVEV
jgi:hypothetical protein